MANQEHLDILKQGVGVWNQWREKHREIQPDLKDVNLSGANLSEANFKNGNLSRVNLKNAHLKSINLIGAELREANFTRADLTKADLSETDLTEARFTRANLNGAYLNDAQLAGADFTRARLIGTYLTGAVFTGADLTGTDFTKAHLTFVDLSGALFNETNLTNSSVGNTIFGNVDLRQVQGLDTLRHERPSTIGIDTIYHSQGQIPEIFLRGAGVPDSFIEYMHALVFKPIDYYTCFISYSSKDQVFAERLYADLRSKCVRCWFAPKDMKIGDKIRPRIDESIRQYDKLLLVLSQHSLASTWVEKEVETAFDKEAKSNTLVLFPVRLDDIVMQTDQAWAADIRRMRHIGDFTRWKNHDDYQQAFERLLRDLKAGE